MDRDTPDLTIETIHAHLHTARKPEHCSIASIAQRQGFRDAHVFLSTRTLAWTQTAFDVHEVRSITLTPLLATYETIIAYTGVPADASKISAIATHILDMLHSLATVAAAEAIATYTRDKITMPRMSPAQS